MCIRKRSDFNVSPYENHISISRKKKVKEKQFLIERVPSL